MTRSRKNLCVLIAAVLALLAVLWAYGALLQPVRDQHQQQALTRLLQDEDFPPVHVLYTGQCVASDPAGRHVPLTAVVYDSETYPSRSEVPATYSQSARTYLANDLRAQAEAQGLTLVEPVETAFTMTRTIEE